MDLRVRGDDGGKKPVLRFSHRLLRGDDGGRVPLPRFLPRLKSRLNKKIGKMKKIIAMLLLNR